MATSRVHWRHIIIMPLVTPFRASLTSCGIFSPVSLLQVVKSHKICNVLVAGFSCACACIASCLSSIEVVSVGGRERGLVTTGRMYMKLNGKPTMVSPTSALAVPVLVNSRWCGSSFCAYDRYVQRTSRLRR